MSLIDGALHFGQAHEKDADKFVKCIQHLNSFCEDHGLESVFTIVLSSTKEVNLLKCPGLADEQMIKRWIKDLTKDGVIADEVGTRYPVCHFDELNLHLSGKAVLNSCSESLRKAVERAIPMDAQHVGTLVYYHVIN